MQVHAELHHACAGGHIDSSIETDISFRGCGWVISNPSSLTAGSRLVDATCSRIRISIAPAIKAVERISAKWKHFEVSFIDHALGSLIKGEFDLASGIWEAIHRDLVGCSSHRLKNNLAGIVDTTGWAGWAGLVILCHRGQGGERLAGVNSEAGVKLASECADASSTGVGWRPSPPDRVCGRLASVGRLAGLTSGLVIGAGHAGITSRERGAIFKVIVVETLIKGECDLASGTCNAIHRDLVGRSSHRSKNNLVGIVDTVVLVVLVIPCHQGEGSERPASVNSEVGVKSTSSCIDRDPSVGGSHPFPPYGFCSGVVVGSVGRLVGFSRGLGIGAGHAGIISRERGAACKGIVGRAA